MPWIGFNYYYTMKDIDRILDGNCSQDELIDFESAFANLHLRWERDGGLTTEDKKRVKHCMNGINDS